jgi:DNA-binding transcriptional MerR regulator
LKEQRYSIEQVTERLGVTARTLHYYEEIGLIPTMPRTEGGHRLYEETAIRKVEHILQMKHVLGCSLQEIRTILEAEQELDSLRQSYYRTESQPARTVVRDRAAELLRRQIELIDDKVRHMLEMKEHFAARLDRVEAHEDAGMAAVPAELQNDEE